MIEIHFILNILVCFLALAIALLFVLHIIEVVAFHGAGRKSKLRQLMSVVLFSIDRTARTISTSRESIESYINDNIGFRSFL